MSQIAIFNYSDSTVTVRELPNHICDCEEIEEWIESELGMRINDVHYMSSDNLKINIDVHNVSQSIEFSNDR
jgi:hypothetical protein